MWQLATQMGYSCGDQNFGGALTGFLPDTAGLVFENERPRKKRGPRSELTDPQLHNRRDQLVQAFEGLWGEIGWNLRTCKKADDLVCILRPLAELYTRDIVAVFFRPSSEPASRSILVEL